MQPVGALQFRQFGRLDQQRVGDGHRVQRAVELCFPEGEELVELDPTDYRLAIKQKESELAKAKFNLKLELGQQAIVKREFQLLGADLNDQEQELVLRKPHLNAAKAALAAAEAALEQAHLDLSRTRPVAPFNAIITTRNANIGAWMSAFSTGTPLAKLVGTDEGV